MREAVARIYEAKGRPSFNPLIVHVADLEQAERSAASTTQAKALAEAHWPGPLTLVLPLRDGRARSPRWSPPACRPSRSASPAHPAMQALLDAVGRPLAAPSANASGRISPTRAEPCARQPRRPHPADRRRRPDRSAASNRPSSR